MGLLISWCASLVSALGIGGISRRVIQIVPMLALKTCTRFRSHITRNALVGKMPNRRQWYWLGQGHNFVCRKPKDVKIKLITAPMCQCSESLFSKMIIRILCTSCWHNILYLFCWWLVIVSSRLLTFLCFDLKVIANNNVIPLQTYTGIQCYGQQVTLWTRRGRRDSTVTRRKLVWNEH